jgi:adenylate kinase
VKLEAILLLGPTGSGKTPLGDWLERDGLWGLRCHHFDFGANLRAAAAGEGAGSFSPAETRFLRRVLQEGALLDPEHFPLATRILDAFLKRRAVPPADLLVLNGLPRHLDQARAIGQRVRVIRVVQLDCNAAVVRERLKLNSGGDRTQRVDDAESLVERKLATYEKRTRPLVDYYLAQGVEVLNLGVEIATRPADLGERLEARRS